jgi:hypothetical protein
LPRVVERMVEFFGQDLPPDARRTPAASPSGRGQGEGRPSPTQAALGLLQEALGLLTVEPGAGRCLMADMAVEVTLAGQTPYSGRVLFVRGSEGRFKLQCKLPVVGDVAIGQGTYPWMASAQKTLFRGVGQRPEVGRGQNKPLDPPAFVSADAMLRLRMLAGLVGGAAMAPDILDPWVAITEDPSARGPRTIRIALKEPNRGTARLVLKDDGRSPQSLAFEAPGASGSVKFLGWKMNTAIPEGVFDPPAGLTSQDVPAEDLQRMFSAMFDFVLEKAE